MNILSQRATAPVCYHAMLYTYPRSYANSSIFLSQLNCKHKQNKYSEGKGNYGVFRRVYKFVIDHGIIATDIPYPALDYNTTP